MGTAAVHSTASLMAAFDIFDLTLTGKGCHAAMPHLGKDALLAACQLVTQLPALIAREQKKVHKPAVLSVTSFNAGDAWRDARSHQAARHCALLRHASARIEQRFARCDCRDLRAARPGGPSRLPSATLRPSTAPSMLKSAPKC